MCTGAFLLAERIGAEGATRGVQSVDSVEVVTAGGLSAGIGTALHLVDRLLGRDLAVATARQIEYAWDPDAGADARSAISGTQISDIDETIVPSMQATRSRVRQ